MRLENKVAIVTGAASGIGKDIKPQRAPEWAPFSPTETDCMAENTVQVEPVSMIKFPVKLGKYWEFAVLNPQSLHLWF